jgi:hypothetical protein
MPYDNRKKRREVYAVDVIYIVMKISFYSLVLSQAELIKTETFLWCLGRL